MALKKGAEFSNLTEDDNLGYDPDRMAKTWEVCQLDVYTTLIQLVQVISPPLPSPPGHGGTGREGTGESNWHLQPHHHKDGAPAPDGQDCACREPGRVPPLPPAAEAQGIL